MSFYDHQTNVVYFAWCLGNRYPQLFKEAISFLEDNNVQVKLIENTQNIWCRDYMPIQVGDHFVKFRYADSNFKHRRKPDPSCYKQFDPIPSKILLDGGNVMRWGDKAILTEMVMKDNPGLKVTQLEELLEAEVILIPVEPYDDLGHSDGILNLLSNDVILINNYDSQSQQYWHKYQRRLIKRLGGYAIRLLPYAFDQTPHLTEKKFRKQFPFSDDFNPGFGYYQNFLLVKGVILLPKFNIGKDEVALEKMRELYPTFKIKQIDCSQLSMEGGLLHCVSWNIKQPYTCR